MEYNFREIEKKWQRRWVDNGTYRVVEDEKKKKFYVLNMFPYPSGAGLHVGHPLGYIASDIYARYKRLKGFNVLNPMGYDAYGLPAEQYAIQTGQHPAITTEQNINRYREQLDKIGFSFDWDREVRTCDPKYYKWTQWAFQRMFRSYFSTSSHKAQPIIKLIEHFELMGTQDCGAYGTEELHFTASDWAAFSEKKKQEVLMNYRIAYLADTMVNWCPALGTVLANDEVVNGVSERGGFPVEQKKMRQWCLRVSAYAQRLLDGLETIDWSDSIKEAQRNWIGRSEGTEMVFKVASAPLSSPEGDTKDPAHKTKEAPSGAVGGATTTFSLNGLTVKEAIAATKKYVTETGIGRVKVNYRLRDAIFSRQRYWGEPFPVYYKDDMPYMIPKECLPLELPEIDEYKPTETGEPPLGRAKMWAWDTKTDKVVSKDLIDNKSVFPLELNTMPGFAGSSAYYLRYMDPKNDKALVSKDVDEYWRNVDLYVGGTEHATGHLIYSRFWNKFLFDSGYSCEDEPFKKLVNQGMIQGWSSFVFRIKGTNQYVSYDLLETKYDNDAKKNRYFYNGTEADPIYTDISTVNGKELDIEKIRQWMPDFKEAEFITNQEGKYIISQAIEKMSKSKYNVVNPDDICNDYGADTLRLYEMFLGPIEQSKPWDVAGIDGCHRFLRKFWNLVTAPRNNDVPSKEMMKSVHKLIKKVSQDIEVFSYNTSISAFMICINELSQLKCHNNQLFRQIVVLISPFAPHIAEELWQILGGEGSVCDAQWPEWDEQYLVEDSVRLGVAFNGKTRFDMEFAADADNKTIEETVLADERAKKYTEGMTVKKVIIVPKRMVNIVLGK